MASGIILQFKTKEKKGVHYFPPFDMLDNLYNILRNPFFTEVHVIKFTNLRVQLDKF